MSRRAELSAGSSRCSSQRRCRKRECDHCGPIRAGDEYRKFVVNIEHYGGRVLVVAVTAG
jgi:hypothetical protein